MIHQELPSALDFCRAAAGVEGAESLLGPRRWASLRSQTVLFQQEARPRNSGWHSETAITCMDGFPPLVIHWVSYTQESCWFNFFNVRRSNYRNFLFPFIFFSSPEKDNVLGNKVLITALKDPGGMACLQVCQGKCWLARSSRELSLGLRPGTDHSSLPLQPQPMQCPPAFLLQEELRVVFI